jgi:flagellar motor switch protein FliM
VSGTVNVTPYDLTRPQVLRPRELSALRLAVARFAEALGPFLSEYLGCPANATAHLDPFPHSRESPELSSRGRPCLALPAEGNAAACAWSLDRSLAAALLAAMLGAAPAGKGCLAEPSALQKGLLGRLAAELGGLWAAALPRHPQATSGLPPTREAPGAVAGDPHAWQVVSVALVVGEARGELRLHLPLRSLRPALQAQLPAPPPPAACPSSTMRAAPVTGAVRLGTWRTSLRDLTALQVGQIVPLGVKPDALLNLCLGGTGKLLVRPGSSNGRLSVQVVGGASEGPPPTP